MYSQEIADLLKEIILYIACIGQVELRGHSDEEEGEETSLFYRECKKNGFKIDEAIKSIVEQMISSEDYISLQEECVDNDDLDRLFEYIITYVGIYNFSILLASQIYYYSSKFKKIYKNDNSEDDCDDDSDYVYESDKDDSEDETKPFLVSPLLRRRMNISDDECRNTNGKDDSDDEECEPTSCQSCGGDFGHKKIIGDNGKFYCCDDCMDSDYVYESEESDDESEESDDESEESDDESEESDDESEESDDESEESDDESEESDENKIKLTKNFNINTIKQYLSNGWIDKDGNQCYCIKWNGNEGYLVMLPNNYLEIRFEHDDDNYVANAFVKKYITALTIRSLDYYIKI